jgi:hypothetical protein
MSLAIQPDTGLPIDADTLERLTEHRMSVLLSQLEGWGELTEEEKTTVCETLAAGAVGAHFPIVLLFRMIGMYHERRKRLLGIVGGAAVGAADYELTSSVLHFAEDAIQWAAADIERERVKEEYRL